MMLVALTVAYSIWVIALPIQMFWLSVAAVEESEILLSGITFIVPVWSTILQPPKKWYK